MNRNLKGFNMFTCLHHPIPAYRAKTLRFVTYAALSLFTNLAYAQAWPSKPITVISPYPAGGGVDTVARLISERLAPALNSTITVENRPGAGATIGAARRNLCLICYLVA